MNIADKSQTILQSVELFQPVDVKAFANLVLDWADRSGRPVSPMKLQKIVYFCHADFLVFTGKPLILQNFEAWEYGPVVPCLYDEFKLFGANAIQARAYRFNPMTCQKELAAPCDFGELESFVRTSFEAYARHSASVLSNLSHIERGPWAEALKRFENGSPSGLNIENQIIVKHHIHALRRPMH